MPAFRLGYNINAEAAALDKNRQRIADNQIALRSSYALVLDDYKSGFFFTKQIRARSPETEPIHRRYWAVDPNNPDAGGWDGSLHRAPGITADNILNTFEGEQKRHGVKVIEQLYCEPAVHIHKDDPQGNELRAMLKLMVDCVKGASKRSMRLAVDIGQAVTWSQSEIDAGFYDELLFALSWQPEHLLSTHEYALGDLWFNTSNVQMKLLEKASPINHDFSQDSDAEAQLQYNATPHEAHLGRVQLIVDRAKKIGAMIPRIVYTEIGWDRTRIAQQDAVNAINGREAMGYPTLSQYWKVRYPQWTKAQTAFNQLKWLNRAMPDYVVGACIYGYDTSFESGNYHIEDSELQALLTVYSAQVRSIPQPPPRPPVVDLPPTVPPATEWRSQLTDTQRHILSLAKAGELTAIEDTILAMADMLDAYEGRGE